MIRYFASHQTAANILMFIIVLSGFLVLPTLNKETFPQIDTNKIKVTVAYPGASTGEVEEGICNRLEDATDGISFMEEQRCEARDNIGILTLDMQEEGNIQHFLNDVNAAVDGITDFPDNAEEPVVEELGRTKPVVSVAINADLAQPELKALAEYYRDRLLALPETPIVTVSGFSTHQLSVLIKPESLRQYQLSIEDIANRIKSQSIDMPAGILDSDERSYQIRFSNERRTVNELADLIILDNVNGAQLRLGEVARIEDDFTDEEMRTDLNGKPAATLKISKNLTDDTLTIFNAVKKFVDEENVRLPETTRLVITQDTASIVQDRLSLLLRNGWQGLALATLALLLFFTWRYTFWVALGLPISFVGGLVVMSIFGISINMISMVALLMAIGILMDDAIVISESIESEYRNNKSPLQASIDGIRKVARGVFSSFATSAILFGSLLFLKGDMGQIMGVLPVVLLSVLTISLIEAFLILPHHLKHSLERHHDQQRANWRIHLDTGFERLRNRVGSMGEMAIRYRYAVLGGAIALFIISLSLIPAGFIKFKSFPDLEGNILDARIILPQGTPFTRTDEVVSILLESLKKSLAQLPAEEDGELVKNIQVSYSSNVDAGEDGVHLATISLDLLDAEIRVNSLNDLRRLWLEATPTIADAISIQYKEPSFGPAGQAISIRL
ncbi:MAG: efflux RND transporter permease subunit, partial [Gammaproteobacteria bacterium]|nr:efflux RND transporter permease subunit [Gammaproteobacteria bacterium]